MLLFRIRLWSEAGKYSRLSAKDVIFPEGNIVHIRCKWTKGPEFSWQSRQDLDGSRSRDRDALEGTNVSLSPNRDRAVFNQGVGSEQRHAADLGWAIRRPCIGPIELEIRSHIADQRQGQNRSTLRIDGDLPVIAG